MALYIHCIMCLTVAWICNYGLFGGRLRCCWVLLQPPGYCACFYLICINFLFPTSVRSSKWNKLDKWWDDGRNCWWAEKTKNNNNRGPFCITSFSKLWVLPPYFDHISDLSVLHDPVELVKIICMVTERWRNANVLVYCCTALKHTHFRLLLKVRRLRSPSPWCK